MRFERGISRRGRIEVVQRLNRPLLTTALITGLTFAGLTIGASAVAQTRDVGTTSPPAQDVVTPSPIAQDQIATPRDSTPYPEGWRGEVTGAGEIDKCIPEDSRPFYLSAFEDYLDPVVYTQAEISVMSVADFEELVRDRWRALGVDPAPNTTSPRDLKSGIIGSRFETFGCGEWSEGKDWNILVVEVIKSGSERQGDDGNRFELGAEQTAAVDDTPNPPFDGNLGTPQLDLPPDLPNPSGGGGTTATTVFGGAARDGGTGRTSTGGGQRTPQLAGPPPACGEPSDTLQKTYENTMRTMEGMLLTYEQAVAQHAPRVEDSIVVEKGAPTVPQNMAWRKPGIRTLAEGSLFGCFQAGIAQDLRWDTGQPYIAKARALRIGPLSLEVAGGAGIRGEEDVLARYYGGQNHLENYEYSKILRPDQYNRGGWIPVTRQQLDQLISDRGSRGDHPRGLVSLGYDNSSVGHLVNVRWNDASQVELWDASTGDPADLSHVDKYWFFPTN